VIDGLLAATDVFSGLRDRHQSAFGTVLGRKLRNDPVCYGTRELVKKFRREHYATLRQYLVIVLLGRGHA
jgi:hypothetical protein